MIKSKNKIIEKKVIMTKPKDDKYKHMVGIYIYGNLLMEVL